MGEVRLTLFGGFAASVDGTEVPDTAWRLKKAREIVELLALARDRRLHREQAMERHALARPQPAAAANNLNQAVHVARRVLEPDAIGARATACSRSRPRSMSTSTASSRRRRTRGGSSTAAAYWAALALYGGGARRTATTTGSTERRGTADLVLGARGGRGPAHSGSSGTFFTRCPPMRARSSAAAASSPSSGPLLHRTRLLTLTGTGGAGKTRLALEFARGAEGSFEVGVRGARGARRAGRPASRDGDGRGGARHPRLAAQDLGDALTGFLSSRTLLLVLDNCEHVLAQAAALADQAAPCRTEPDDPRDEPSRCVWQER